MKWSPGRKYRELRIRLDAVESLAAVKDVFSYDELSPLLGLPASVLSRYYQGSMIPSVDTAKSMLEVFLSKEFARNFIYKAIHEKYGGSLCKLLSNSKMIKYVSLYMYNRILDKLAGSKVSLVLSPPNYSLAVASIIAQRFGVTVLLVPNYLYRNIKSNLTDLKGLPVHHGSMAVAIFMTFNKDDLLIIREFINKFRLDLKLIETIVLADIIPRNQLPSGAEIEYILP